MTNEPASTNLNPNCAPVGYAVDCEDCERIEGASDAPRTVHTQAPPSRAVEDAMESAAKTPMVSGEWLGALAVRVKLHRTEWRVLAIVISSPNPVSASSVARRLRLDYGLVKRVVRELVLWNIL